MVKRFAGVYDLCKGKQICEGSTEESSEYNQGEETRKFVFLLCYFMIWHKHDYLKILMIILKLKVNFIFSST